jgi:hypothetical protein
LTASSGKTLLGGFEAEEPEDEEDEEGFGDFGAATEAFVVDDVEARRFFGPFPAGPSSVVRECRRVCRWSVSLVSERVPSLGRSVRRARYKWDLSREICLTVEQTSCHKCRSSRDDRECLLEEQFKIRMGRVEAEGRERSKG